MRFFIITIFTLSLAFSALAQKHGEVIVTLTYLRKAPEITAEKVQTVQKGEKFVFEKQRLTNGWYYVSISGGAVKGWIRSDTVRSVKNAEKVSQTAQSDTSQQPLPPSKPVAGSSNAVVSQPSALPSPQATPGIVEEEEVVRIATEEVSLNVRVVDGNNRPVNNLTQADFKIYEDEVLQPITSLTTAEVPIISALVIDNSRSLRAQLKKVIEAGKIIVGTSRPKDESSVVRFVSSDKIEVVQDFTTSVDSLNNALDNLFVEGGQTAVVDAVYQTAKKVGQYQNSQKREDVRLRALVLISDGDDRSSSYKEEELFALLRNQQVQIYAIGFVNDLSDSPDAANNVSRREKAKTFLTRLTQETGGKVYFPNSIDELPQIASDISRELRTQYLISYTPTKETGGGGGFRKIRVVITEGANQEKRTAITRAGRNSAAK
ncbi:MAG TPA: VWA domain-containing protein [Pyrinomonadaceae bacterium]|jgi:Ca-activated chloride channel family protein